MKKYLKFMFLSFATIALASCEKADSANEQEAGSLTAQKGFAVGKVVDSQGKPIAGAKIYLDNTVFYNSFMDGSTGEDGKYKIKVQQGVWKAYASFKKQYNGQTYSIQLYPDKTDSFTDEGAVRNFTWKLEGIDPDNEHYYYGGLITVNTEYGFYEEFEDIEFTLTPKGALIDGSAGKTLKIKYREHYWTDPGYLTDIPVGRYIVTAKLKNNKALKIRKDGVSSDKSVTEFQLDFEPDSSDFRPRTSASIVVGY